MMKRYLINLVACMLLIAGQAAWGSFETATLGANGYDVVAYFTEGKPVKGSTDFFSFHDGALYLFANKEDKDLFDANASKYLPAYGGYCAMAMVLGKKHPTDPEAFLIVDGKLYLNKAKVRPKWLEDVPGHIKKANENWEKIKDIDPGTL